jgi:hypothetical protein
MLIIYYIQPRHRSAKDLIPTPPPFKITFSPGYKVLTIEKLNAQKKEKRNKYQ